MDKDENEIKAVHEQDLENAIQTMGLLDELKAGKLTCKFCGTTITLENMHSILPHSQGFSFICDTPECVEKLMDYIEEQNSTRHG